MSQRGVNYGLNSFSLWEETSAMRLTGNCGYYDDVDDDSTNALSVTENSRVTDNAVCNSTRDRKIIVLLLAMNISSAIKFQSQSILENTNFFSVDQKNV
ncbi:jg15358 [Pararge aegeria aegeria]|uniref:Jg15358 protein n=1 Tax=Pararge aegeria aegeria TaxID=348720 RepID=A0A8S4QZP3_9NEOP|nr:jg15358 [Pararge aegeria aegeria]